VQDSLSHNNLLSRRHHATVLVSRVLTLEDLDRDEEWKRGMRLCGPGDGG
jgi:hypothetical protein